MWIDWAFPLWRRGIQHSYISWIQFPWYKLCLCSHKENSQRIDKSHLQSLQFSQSWNGGSTKVRTSRPCLKSQVWKVQQRARICFVFSMRTFSSRHVHSRRIQCALFDLMWGCLLTQPNRHGNNDFQRGIIRTNSKLITWARERWPWWWA